MDNTLPPTALPTATPATGGVMSPARSPVRTRRAAALNNRRTAAVNNPRLAAVENSPAQVVNNPPAQAVDNHPPEMVDSSLAEAVDNPPAEAAVNPPAQEDDIADIAANFVPFHAPIGPADAASIIPDPARPRSRLVRAFRKFVPGFLREPLFGEPADGESKFIVVRGKRYRDDSHVDEARRKAKRRREDPDKARLPALAKEIDDSTTGQFRADYEDALRAIHNCIVLSVDDDTYYRNEALSRLDSLMNIHQYSPDCEDEVLLRTYGGTPLHAAISLNAPEAVTLLLEGRADLTRKFNGVTPLELAFELGYCVQQMINRTMLLQGKESSYFEMLAERG